eukprot:scaffold36670_cov42-Phaeocystis_antarctica.AAC.4
MGLIPYSSYVGGFPESQNSPSSTLQGWVGARARGWLGCLPPHPSPLPPPQTVDRKSSALSKSNRPSTVPPASNASKEALSTPYTLYTLHPPDPPPTLHPTP